MKKFTFFVVAVLCAAAFVHSQRVSDIPAVKKEYRTANFSINDQKPNGQLMSTSKAGGDSIYFYDMSDQTGWTTEHHGATTNDWQFGPANQNLVDYMGDMNSYVTGSGNPIAYVDGITYLLNSNYVESNASLITPALDFSGYNGVIIKWNQRFKAYNGDSALVEFSTDGGTTWGNAIHIGDGLGTNEYDPISSHEFNISSIVANEATVKVRFRWFGPQEVQGNQSYGGGYGWQIDDVAFVEAFANDLKISSVIPGFIYTNGGTYKQIPAAFRCDPDEDSDFEILPMPMRIFFSANVFNNGAAAQPNVDLRVTVKNDAGTKTYYDAYSDAPYALLAPTAEDTVGHDQNTPFSFNGFTAGDTVLTKGSYDITFEAMSDSVDHLIADNIMVYNFELSDTVYARDNGDVANSENISPYSWQGWGDGDIFGVRYEILYKNTEVRTMSAYVSEDCTFDNNDVGATIRGKILISDGAGGYSLLLESDPIDLTASMAGTWITIPFNTDGFSEFLIDDTYLAAIEVVDFNGQELYFGSDAETPQDIFSTIWYFQSGGNWTAITNYEETPMIRLNLYSDVVGINDVNSNLSFVGQNYPNPFNDVTTIDYELAKTSDVSFSITNLTGQTVYSADYANANAGQNRIVVQSVNLESGIYYYSIVADGYRTTKKMTVVK